MKPIIGIVGRPIIDDCKTHNIGTMESYRKSLIKAGANTICIMPPQDIVYEDFAPRNTPRLTDEEKNMIIEQINLCDGIIMPGGTKWYEYDEIICKYCIKNDIPIFGICMGEQLMGNISLDDNIIDGDKTVQNQTKINHSQPSTNYVHKININKSSRLYDILQKECIIVNSRHKYHIEKTGPFCISAVSEDGLIEAIELPSNKFAIGVQWHPESLIEFDENAQKLFKAFVDSTKSK